MNGKDAMKTSAPCPPSIKNNQIGTDKIHNNALEIIRCRTFFQRKQNKIAMTAGIPHETILSPLLNMMNAEMG
ncbi:hypothetical protein [Paenibacillus polymyxa]|uniref:hypothetical protein n=2 Tax=Paenibacillus TaxID=44249 RepID=UPI001F2B5907|nr:hypothetical protein [Paenibacillus polymyxa]